MSTLITDSDEGFVNDDTMLSFRGMRPTGEHVHHTELWQVWIPNWFFKLPLRASQKSKYSRARFLLLTVDNCALHV